MTEYFNWLREVMGWRIINMEPDFNDLIKNIPIPESSEKEMSSFENLVKENMLNKEQQLVFLLSLIPFYIPFDFNTNNPKDEEALRKLLFNKSLINQANYPTIDTAFLLLAGSNIKNRK